MRPGAGCVSERDQLGQWIERAGVDIAGLEADDGRPVKLWEGIGAHASLVIRRHAQHALAPQPQQAKRLEDGSVRLLAHDDRDRWSAKEAPRLHIPTSPRQHGMARGSQSGATMA